MAKIKKIKDGFYAEKTWGFVYLYLSEIDQWIYLPDDVDDETLGTVEYHNNAMIKNTKYIGGTVNDLAKFIVNKSLN